jgi:large subunit ribosomal protein L14e
MIQYFGSPKIGQIAKVIRGNEVDTHVVIIEIIDTKFVMIADGKKRKFDNPKKKNILHLQLQDSISQEVLESIEQTGRVTNGKLKFALINFHNNITVSGKMKGE